MILIHHLLWSYLLITGFNGYGNSVFIRSAYEEHICPFQPEIPYINVGRNINTCQVPNMNRPVGIGQRRGDEDAARVRIGHAEREPGGSEETVEAVGEADCRKP